MGPITRKFASLRDLLNERVGTQLSPLELQQIAGAIDALLPLVERLENRPLPPRLRVLDGGKPPAA